MRQASEPGPPAARVAGTFAVAAALAFVAALFAEGGALAVGAAGRRALLACQSLLLLPTAAVLALWAPGSRRPVAVGATVAGAVSLLLWGSAPYGQHWELEPLWLIRSAAWWLGIGWAIRERRRTLGAFTIVLGIVAATDAVVTALEEAIPFWAFALFGGPKIPLQVVWMVWVGVALIRTAAPSRAAS